MQYYDDERNANAASADKLSQDNNLKEQSESAGSSLAHAQYGKREDGLPSGRKVFFEITLFIPLALDYLTNFKLIITRSYPYAVAQRSRAGPRSAKASLRESYALGAALSHSRGPPAVCVCRHSNRSIE